MAKAYRRVGKARPRAIKVTVSIPAELLTAAESSERAQGRTRSAIVQEALRAWLGEYEQSVLVREYAEGYRRMPENASEVKASEAAAVRLLADEEW